MGHLSSTHDALAVRSRYSESNLTFPSFFYKQLHFVHWNTTDFATFGDAAKSKGGLAVLGVLLVVGIITTLSVS